MVLAQLGEAKVSGKTAEDPAQVYAGLLAAVRTAANHSSLSNKPGPDDHHVVRILSEWRESSWEAFAEPPRWVSLADQEPGKSPPFLCSVS